MYRVEISCGCTGRDGTEYFPKAIEGHLLYMLADSFGGGSTICVNGSFTDDNKKACVEKSVIGISYTDLPIGEVEHRAESIASILKTAYQQDSVHVGIVKAETSLFV